ncbi:MAG: UvrD-helicase domain-containing protein [Bacteroidales bacterium]
MGLTIYKASAGSGKTYTMAVDIIAVLIKNPQSYKNILAITFTNKAAGELKTRVVKVLGMLSRGDKADGYFDNVQDKSRLEERVIIKNAGLVLKHVLHDYSRLSISTIDRFFNRILASFAYETNIRPDSEISLDDKVSREEALDDLLSGFRLDSRLGKWLMAYSKTKIEDDKNWNIRSELLNESDIISKEGFLQKEHILREINEDKSILEDFRDKVFAIKQKHEIHLKNTGLQAKNIIDDSDFDPGDFKNGKSGGAGFLLGLADKGFRDITNTVINCCHDHLQMLTKPMQKREELVRFVENKLHPLLCQTVDYMIKYRKEYTTALALVKNINSFGVLLDINLQLRRLCSERNIYFPFQMSQLLHDIVSLDNALFVYEKMGTRYRHYFLDEFQDTSRMQWDILRPLLEESLASGGQTMIVGDVKQSIYRWRNGDWNLLSSQVELDLPGAQNETLKQNFRSRKNIVLFNNHITRALLKQFTMAVDNEVSEPDPEFDFYKLYGRQDFIQIPRKTKAPFGEVKLRFLEGKKKDTWQKTAMDEMVAEMKSLMDKGYSAGDMAVITDNNKDAGKIALRLMEEDGKDNYSFPVVSASSLLLSEQPVVQLLLVSLKWIDNPEDYIALSQIVYTYQIYVLGNTDYKPQPVSPDREDVIRALVHDLPEEFTRQRERLAAWPLYDLTENLIHWYGLDAMPKSLAFINAFQDNVLSYSERNTVEIASFIKWFEKKDPKLEMPDASGAVVISTVHKAKGLEFRFVFMPFTDWKVSRSNARDALWVEPDVPPFNDFPLVLVDYEKALKDSYFSKSYDTENFKKHVDLLNKLYVAFTRAGEGLYIWGPEHSGNKMQSANSFLCHAVKAAGNGADAEYTIPDWNACFDEDESGFHLGSVPPYDPEKEDEVQETERLKLDSYPLNIRDNSMRYHHPDAFIKLDQDEQILHKTSAGSVCHAVLESVKTPEDIPEAIENIVRSGRISREEAVEYEKLIKSAMQREPVSQWFSADVNTINERDILMPDGSFIKPDRVVFTENETVVVDYKFGKKRNAKYNKQVQNYMNALDSMGYENVKGYIWYVFLDQISRVELE